MTEILDIVNEKDEVIGQAERDVAHRDGLKIRFSYVWFYTPDGNVILQKRGHNKKSNPGKLTMTVSGHVSSGHTYLETAIQETKEEAGIYPNPDNLTLIDIYPVRIIERPGYISDGMRAVYAYKFEGDISDLAVEEGEGDGFVMMNIKEARRLIAAEPDKFVTFIAESHGDLILDEISKLITS